MLPSGRQTVLANRVGWALLGMERAGLVERVRRAVYRMTDEGGRLLARGVDRVDDEVLATYPAFAEWKKRERQPRIDSRSMSEESRETPEETLTRAAGAMRAILEAELLDRFAVRLPRTTRPASGASSPASVSSTDVLPEPLGPTMALRSDRRSSISRLRTIGITALGQEGPGLGPSRCEVARAGERRLLAPVVLESNQGHALRRGQRLDAKRSGPDGGNRNAVGVERLRGGDDGGRVGEQRRQGSGPRTRIGTDRKVGQIRSARVWRRRTLPLGQRPRFAVW